MRIYDLRTARLVGSTQLNGSLQGLDFSPDGKGIAAASLAGDISIWDLQRRTQERLIHHNPAILSLRFSPDGNEIVTGDLAGNVDFWDPATGRQVGRTLGGQNGPVLSVTFNPSGNEVITTSTDGKLRLWDLASGKLVGAPLPGAATDGSGTFFPDGKQVISVFRSGSGVIWKVDPAAWKAQACNVAHRNLTPSEWRDFLPQRDYHAVCS